MKERNPCLCAPWDCRCGANDPTWLKVTAVLAVLSLPLVVAVGLYRLVQVLL